MVVLWNASRIEKAGLCEPLCEASLVYTHVQKHIVVEDSVRSHDVAIKV